MKPLFCFLGESGSGKSTICEALEKELGMKQIPSYTTRPPRYEGEKGHTFVSEAEYDKLHHIIAENTTTGYRYCVTQDQLDNEEYELYVVDLTGLKMLRNRYSGNRNIIGIYVSAPLRQRYERMKIRYCKEDAVDKTLQRIVSDVKEFDGCASWCQYTVVNSDSKFDDTMNNVKAIIKQERKRLE